MTRRITMPVIRKLRATWVDTGGRLWYNLTPVDALTSRRQAMIRETPVVQYICSDGTTFYYKGRAEDYEAEYLSVLPIRNRIPRTALKHGTYVQHDAQTLRQIRRDLWPLVLEKVNASVRHKAWLEWNPDEVHPMSGVGRVLSDCGGPVAKAWADLARFDLDTGREYDQPYFSLNPDKAVPFVPNPT